MDKKEWIIVISIIIIVAVVSSFVSMSLTGNVIKVSTSNSKKAPEVYTKAEIDAKLANLSQTSPTPPNPSSQELYLLRATNFRLDVGTPSVGIVNAVTGSEVCMNKKINSTCIMGNVVILIESIDYQNKAVSLRITSQGGYLQKESQSLVYNRNTDDYFMAAIAE
jgi:hypothetical protein